MIMKTKSNKMSKNINDSKAKQHSLGKLKNILQKTTPSKSKHNNSTKQTSKSQSKVNQKKLRVSAIIGSPSSNKKLKNSPKTSSKGNESRIRTLQRQKMLDQYLRHKIISQKQKGSLLLQSTYSFNANAMEAYSQIQNLYLNGQKHLVNSIFQSQSKVIPSIIDQCYEQFKQKQQDEYKMKKEVKLSQRNDWQKYQTLRLKNQELSNYIEELQQIQAKLTKQNAEHCSKLTSQYQKQKQELIKQIGSLKADHKDRDHLIKEIEHFKAQHQKILADNATLQQMFNEVKNNEFRLQRQLSEQNHNFMLLLRQKQLSDKKYKECFQQKILIKQKAQQILVQIRQLRDYQADE